MNLAQIAHDDVSDRALFVLELKSFAQPFPKLLFPSEHFVCFLAADFRDASDGHISRIVMQLLDAGACYFVCWGPGCERAHDLIEDILLAHEACSSETSVIMTTWHANEAIEDTLHFFLTYCCPAEAYQDSARSSLAVTIESPEVAQQVQTALADPEEFLARVCAGE